MKVTVEGVNDEILELIPGGWGPDARVNMVIGDKNRSFIPVRLDHVGSIFGEEVSRLYLEEIIVVVKTKQQIKAEEAVKAAEESLKRAKEALEAVKK